MNTFEEAVMFAAKKHAGMKRKLDGEPYILHPIEAALIASTMTQDEEVLAAAVLHDVVEDTDTAPEELERLFGSRVAALVASETEDKHPELPKAVSWLMRKRESLRKLENADDIAVKIVWLSDKLSNMRSLYRARQRLGSAVWDGFNQKDPAKHGAYYRTAALLLKELCEYDAWKEYDRLVETVFKGVPCGDIRHDR